MRTFELKVGGRYVPLGKIVLLAVILTAVGGVALLVGAKWFVASEFGREFLARYPAVPDGPPVPEGFPVYVRLAHFFNFLFMVFIVRSGLQILADHPRLYTNIHSTPDTEWLRFRGPVPRDRLWTAKDDAIRVPGWLGIPGGRHTIGLARHWHFFMDILFVVNGVIFVALNFAAGEWVRLVPVSWEVIPQAFSGFILYSSLQDPSALAGVSGFVRYNALQQVIPSPFE